MKNGPAIPPAVTAVVIIVILAIVGFFALKGSGAIGRGDSGIQQLNKADPSKLSNEQIDEVRKGLEAARQQRSGTSN